METYARHLNICHRSDQVTGCACVYTCFESIYLNDFMIHSNSGIYTVITYEEKQRKEEKNPSHSLPLLVNMKCKLYYLI